MVEFGGSRIMGMTVVTGANRGIGLELVRQLRAREVEVVAVCRQSSPALDSLGARIESGFDVADARAWPALAERLAHEEVDLLIHNAGIGHFAGLADTTPQDVLAQFQVNALAPLFLTQAMLPRLHRGSKVALVSSRMGSIADNGSGGCYGYRMSKAALNAAGMSLAHDLRSRGIAVVTLHPGAVRTEMTDGHGDIDASAAAAGLLRRIDELTMATTGRFLHANGTELPW
jgi:NAD(P)-dependent dehydrogenase (short-subunit alcohol dehydrogenase family)